MWKKVPNTRLGTKKKVAFLRSQLDNPLSDGFTEGFLATTAHQVCDWAMAMREDADKAIAKRDAEILTLKASLRRVSSQRNKWRRRYEGEEE